MGDLYLDISLSLRSEEFNQPTITTKKSTDMKILEQDEFHVVAIVENGEGSRKARAVLSSDQLTPSRKFIKLGGYCRDDVTGVYEWEKVKADVLEIVDDMTETHFKKTTNTARISLFSRLFKCISK